MYHEDRSYFFKFSLDLSKPIELNIHSEGNVDEILSVLQPYIVD